MSKPDPKTLHILEQQIADYRQKLMDLWESRGMTDNDVLTVSVKLDKLLNTYQKLILK